MPNPEENSTPASYEDLKKDPYKNNLQNLTKEIDDLTDDDKTNDNIDRSVIVEDQLNDALKDYLLKDKKVTDLIEGELNRIINDSKISPEAKNCANKLLALIKSIHSTNETSTTIETTEQSEEPKLGLKGELGEITPLGSNTKGRFYDKLVENKPEGASNEQNEDDLSLRKTKETLNEQLTKINELSSKNPDFLKNEDFIKSKRLIEGIWGVIKNPVEGNVVKLQEFISENLKGTTHGDKFDAASRKKSDGKFDGKFGVGTLAGLKKVLEKTGKYINDVSAKLDKPDTQEVIPETLKGVELKENPIKIKKDGEIKPEEWLKGLPGDGAKVSIKEGNLEMTKTSPQKLTLLVELPNNDKREFPVEVIVVEDTDVDTDPNGVDSDPNRTTQQRQDVGPLTDSDGSQHLVSPDSEALAQKYQLEGATFFTTGKDDEYLLKLGENQDNVYRVKIDGDGLCPTAKNLNGESILFENNPACISYLQAKAPEGAKIGWHNGLKDYTITLNNGSTLTIEPMTIDGKWVSEDLKECLALLNFTNYLRSYNFIDSDKEVKFKNDDPDLKLDDGVLKVRVNKKSNGGEKWYDVPMERFGLTGIDEKVLKKFIKYNNGEHWEDDWDKKEGNKGYNKIKLPAVSIEATGPAPTSADVIPGDLTQAREGHSGILASETGEKLTLDNGIISKLKLSELENSAAAAKRFNIPENATIYKSNDSECYYFKQGNDIVCVGLEPNQEWKKWKLGGEQNTSYYEGINECPEGMNKLNSILKDSLKELQAAGLIDNNESENNISINIEDGKYIFVNGENKLPIYDDILMKKDFCKNFNGPDTKDKLKMLYLASKNVPGNFELKNGDIIITNEDKTQKGIISSDVLSKYGLDVEIAKTAFVDYLNNLSKEDLVNGEDDSGDGAEFTDEGNTRKWKNGNEFVGEIRDGKIMKGVLTLKTGREITSFNVERDEKGLKIIDGPNQDKYVNETTWEIGGTPTEATSKIVEIGADLYEAVNSKLGIKIEGDKYSYNVDKVNEYLGEQRGKKRAELENDVAYIAAVQILLNEKAGESGTKIKVDGKYKIGGETYNAVKKFQEEYNKKSESLGAVTIALDGVPGKDTLAVLLDGKLGDTILDGKRKVDQNGAITFLDRTEIKEENGRKYIEVEGKKYYQYKSGMNGLGYYSDITNGHEGCLYIGNFENGNRTGKGIMTWADGSKYDGNFENGNRTGKGIMTWADGDKYVGNWENGRRTGEGTYTRANGNKFVGKFENSERMAGTFIVNSGASEVRYGVDRVDGKCVIISGPEGDSNIGKYVFRGEIVDEWPSS